MQYSITGNEVVPATIITNSLYDFNVRAAGKTLSKVITLSANNTSQSLNIAQLTGSVLVRRLYGIITTKTTLANLTAGQFDLYDSTSAVALTLNTGVLTNMAVGTVFGKNAGAGTIMFVNNNVAGAVAEGAGVSLYWECVITQKTAASTYIRFTYTTTDAPINATFTIYVDYVPIGASTLVAV